MLFANKFFLLYQRKTGVLMEIPMRAIVAENREPALLYPCLVGNINNFLYHIRCFIFNVDIGNSICIGEWNFTGNNAYSFGYSPLLFSFIASLLSSFHASRSIA